MKRNKSCLKILRYRKQHPFVFYSMILYLGTILGYVIFFHVYFADYSKPMPLNEIGDFLAGVFAPIAFFYLYLGYVQQGTELKQNTKALKLQADELKNSVVQQEELVKTTREELELTKKGLVEQRYKELVQSQPYFHIEHITLMKVKNTYLPFKDGEEFNAIYFSFQFSNSRAICRELNIMLSTPYHHVWNLQEFDLIEPNINKKYSYSYMIPYTQYENWKWNKLLCHFQYSDSLDDMQFHNFVFTIKIDEKDSVFVVTVAKGTSSFQ